MTDTPTLRDEIDTAVACLEGDNPYCGRMHHAEERENWRWEEGFEAGKEAAKNAVLAVPRVALALARSAAIDACREHTEGREQCWDDGSLPYERGHDDLLRYVRAVAAGDVKSGADT